MLLGSPLALRKVRHRVFTHEECLLTQLVSGKAAFEQVLKSRECSSDKIGMHAKHLEIRREGEIKQNYIHI